MQNKPRPVQGKVPTLHQRSPTGILEDGMGASGAWTCCRDWRLEFKCDFTDVMDPDGRRGHHGWGFSFFTLSFFSSSFTLLWESEGSEWKRTRRAPLRSCKGNHCGLFVSLVTVVLPISRQIKATGQSKDKSLNSGNSSLGQPEASVWVSVQFHTRFYTKYSDHTPPLFL